MAFRKSLPFGIIVMILMMALATVGVGYAWWTEDLTALGTVHTGNIDVKMVDPNIEETDILDVGICTPSIIDGGKALTVLIENGYPGYSCTVLFDLNNQGTVPAKISSVNNYSVLTHEYVVTVSGALLNKPMLNPSDPKRGSFTVRIRPGALQNTPYQFDFSIDIVQGNAP